MIPMNSVEYLVGTENIVTTPLHPYGEETMAFCAELSKLLMRSPFSRTYPDLSALAFWCRRANLQKRKEQCPEAEQRLGRGLCFHVAPGNVPINFAFSYLFGVLSGCANIVRVSSKPFPQTEPVCRMLAETLEDFPSLKERTAIVRYPADRSTTETFSAMADARIIWGGDTTIQNIRSMSCAPRCVDICFADRYSVCLIDGDAVLAADKPSLSRLAEGFYHDTYLMDQNACSSPQLILWQNSSPAAKERFWAAVYDCTADQYNLQPAVSADKYAHLFEDIWQGVPVKEIRRHGNLLYRVVLSSLPKDMVSLRGKGGYFYEYDLENLFQLTSSVTEKYQTLTYFGMDPENVRQFIVEQRLRGIDRIVPVGKALDIDIMWDGYDIVRMLSRRIDVV